MNAYIYQADIYCANCAHRIRMELNAERTRRGLKPLPRNAECDSDDFPQGPYPNGGGESDSPQHCGNCGGFLENPLTSDGYRYVREEADRKGRVWKEWAEYYGIETEV